MRYNHVLFVFLLIIFGLINNTYADTLTWTNGGGDNLASNAENWSAAVVPQDGDEVVFNNTSDDCVWDLAVTLDSLDIQAGFSGTISISSTSALILDKTIVWNGMGSNKLASNPSNWSGNVVPQSGDKIVFNDSSSKDCTWDISIAPALFTTTSAYTGTVTLNEYLSITGNLTVAAGTLNLNDNDLLVYGYFLIGAGATVRATSSTIEVKGDWANGGTFVPDTSTVILSGFNQTIYGNTTFNNLIKTITVADTLYFEAGSTQTIATSLTLQGFASNLLSLRSTVEGEYWYIDPQGTRNISFASIKDMKNINFVDVVPLNSVDDGHNDDVTFGGSECVCLERGFISALVLWDEGGAIC